MKKFANRILGVVLSAAIAVTSIPLPADAHWDTSGDAQPTSIRTAENGTVDVGDDWETVYPYGAFLFDKSEAMVTEGGDEITIPLYRLGGTSGRATAYLVYGPVVTYVSEDRVVNGSGAGSEDVEISTEDTLPIARYQAVGKTPDPERSSVQIREAVYAGADAEEGDKVLSVSTTADSYQWQVFYDGKWEKADGATDSDFVASADLLEEVDVRCTFERGDRSYCTDSYKGETYVRPEPEELEEMPDDLDLRPDQTFTSVEMDHENPYNAIVFSMTFAEGEWKKEIRVKAPDNDAAQPMRFGTFTIADNYGGAIFTDASTVTLEVMDNDEGGPYSIDFEETEVEADRSEGKAVVVLKRNGGGQDPIPWTMRPWTALPRPDATTRRRRVPRYSMRTWTSLPLRYL